MEILKVKAVESVWVCMRACKWIQSEAYERTTPARETQRSEGEPGRGFSIHTAIVVLSLCLKVPQGIAQDCWSKLWGGPDVNFCLHPPLNSQRHAYCDANNGRDLCTTGTLAKAKNLHKVYQQHKACQ